MGVRMCMRMAVSMIVTVPVIVIVAMLMLMLVTVVLAMAVAIAMIMIMVMRVAVVMAMRVMVRWVVRGVAGGFVRICAHRAGLGCRKRRRQPAIIAPALRSAQSGQADQRATPLSVRPCGTSTGLRDDSSSKVITCGSRIRAPQESAAVTISGAIGRTRPNP